MFFGHNQSAAAATPADTGITSGLVAVWEFTEISGTRFDIQLIKGNQVLITFPSNAIEFPDEISVEVTK